MIFTWMLYSVALAALVALAGRLLEGAAHLLGTPTRGIWTGALLLGGGAPLLGVWLRGTANPTEAIYALRSYESVAMTAASVADALPLLDEPLLWAWVSMTAVLGVLIGRAFLRLRATRRGWRRAEVEGVEVWLSEEVGPGVVGILRPKIVLPRWAVEGTPEVRRMILEHEIEHAAAHDPLLLSLSLWIPALMPWNPALWWVAHRLRIALEVDCDARVLELEGRDRRSYGSLLLSVGQRRLVGEGPMLAFSRPKSVLEHRIRRLCHANTGPRRRRAGALMALAIVLVAAGAWVPGPPRTDQLGGLQDSCFLHSVPSTGDAEILARGLEVIDTGGTVVADS